VEKLFIAIGTVMFVFVTMLLVGAFFAFPVMLCWNWVMPAISGLPRIDFLHAWGVLVLCGLLFKNPAIK